MYLHFLVSFFIANAAQATPCAVDETKDSSHFLVGKTCPTDIVAYLHRAAQCSFVAGEFGGAATGEDLNAEMKRLHCRRVNDNSEKNALDKKYRSSPAILKSFHETLDRIE